MKKDNIENVTPEEVTTTPETSTEVTTGVVDESTETLTEPTPPTPKKKSIALPLICVILGLCIAVFAYLSLTKGNKPVEVDTDSLESSTSILSSSSSETSVNEESSEEESEVSSTISSTTSSRPTTSSSRPATVSSSTPQTVSSTPTPVSSTTPPPVSSTAPPPSVSSTAPPPPPAAWVCSRAEADSIAASVNAWLEANGGVNWSLSWENNEGYTLPTQADLWPSYDACLNNVLANAQQEISHFGSAGYVRCVVVPYGNTYLIAVVRG